MNYQKLQLTELCQCYLLYEDLWAEWKEYAHSGLSRKDVLVIELFKENNFTLDLEWLGRFYDVSTIEQRLVRPLVKKMRLHYAHFQEWVCARFWVFIINLEQEHGTAWLDTPLKQLQISPELKNLFELFGTDSIAQMIEKFSDEDLKLHENFQHVLSFFRFIKTPNFQKFKLNKYNFFNQTASTCADRN